jgi:exodeoxyribonuclease-3
MADTTSRIRVATWNVNGIRSRQEQFLAWIADASPDVVCLQEIKAARAQLPAELLELSGYWNYWHGAAGGYSGVSLHFRQGRFPAEPEFTHPGFDRETRIVQAAVGDLVFASVYIPNGGKDYPAKLEFLKEMAAYVKGVQADGTRLILSGDMNITRTDMDIHPSQNKPGIIGTRPDERELFEEMIGGGLVDVARMLDPDNDRLYTWWPFWRTARQRNLGWRLDYIFASKGLAKKAVGCTVMREVGTSDHAPVVAEFDIPVP